MWLLYIKCHIYLGRKPDVEVPIINDMYSVYSLGEDCASLLARLLGFLKKYSDTSWRYKLLNTTKRKLSCCKDVNAFISLSLMSEYAISPRFISMLSDENQKKKLMLSLGMFAPDTVALLSDKQIENLESEGDFRRDILLADRLHDNADFANEIILLEKLYSNEQSGSKYVKEKIVRRLFRAYCEADMIKEAIATVVNSFFDNENLIRRCDLSIAKDRIKEKRSKDIYRNIDYPIFMYLADKFDTKEQRIAFSNYLDMNGIVSDEMFFSFVNQNSVKNIFFLEKICSLNSIKRHVRICKNSTMATSIRNEILQKLIIFNPTKKKDYLEEISSITTRREISNRVRLVSQHKIKVDVDKIKLEKNELFEENFQKYILIKSFNSELLGFDITDASNNDSIKRIVESMNEEIKRNPQYSQTILALKDFIADVTYEFLRNEKYGLDNYLSSRIRHGYCKAQLTKELREHHLLLSMIDDDSDRYDISQYWDEKVTDIGSLEYQAVKSALSEFTLHVENKVKEIRRDWIRIQLNKNEVGMFDFSSFVSAALVLDKENIVDYDMMFSYLIGTLWSVTESKLQNIRDRIQSELRSFFIDELNALEKTIKANDKNLVRDICKDILSSITICRVKMQTVLNEFENFFYKDDIVYDDFTIESMTNTCLGIERQIHADFDNIQLDVRACDDRKICGKYFSEFVEIVIMLMNNAISHAGFLEMEEIMLSLTCTIGKAADQFVNGIEALKKMNPTFQEENCFIISVKNNLSEDKDTKKIQERVQYIFDNAKDPNVLKKYSITEGGSGIYKIYKTIHYNVNVPYVILYTVEKNEFALHLAMDASTILV